MKKMFGIILALVLSLGLSIPVIAAPAITPDMVDETIFPGGSIDITKTVTTPEIPPSVDIVLLEDETGSFYDDIANLQSGTTASDIYNTVVAGTLNASFGVAGFRDYAINPYGNAGDWVYRELSVLSPLEADWLAGIALLTAGGGNDTPEAQYDAIVAAATSPTLGWGADTQHVLVVATDAPFHAPDGTHINDQAATIAALNANDIVVVGLKAPGAGGELDALAAATGGSVQALASNGANIGAAILAGLAEVEITVTMTSDASYPLYTTFDPAEMVVASGEDAVFTETISVDIDAPGGTYTAKDWVLINGEPMRNAEGEIIYETKIIHVPEGFITGGGQITDGKGKNALKISFAGNVGFLADFSLVGQWQINFHNVGSPEYDFLDKAHFHSTSITHLQFYNDGGDGPDPPPANANIGFFKADGRLNGEDGWKIRFTVVDRGEPGVNDAIAVSLWEPGGTMVYYQYEDGFDTEWVVFIPGVGTNITTRAAGNLQIHAGIKE